MNQHARPGPAPIPFIDVAAQRRRLGRKVDDAIDRVLGHCQFIMGPEVRALEAETANALEAAGISHEAAHQRAAENPDEMKARAEKRARSALIVDAIAGQAKARVIALHTAAAAEKGVQERTVTWTPAKAFAGKRFESEPEVEAAFDAERDRLVELVRQGKIIQVV